jgi:hypothetical protein
MALIKCARCGHMISDKSTVCVKCGYPTSQSLIAKFSVSGKSLPDLVNEIKKSKLYLLQTREDLMLYYSQNNDSENESAKMASSCQSASVWLKVQEIETFIKDGSHDSEKMEGYIKYCLMILASYEEAEPV